VKTYLSFGGGVNSVALMLLMLDEGVEFETVFSDTGCERPETYAYLGSLKMMGFKITTVIPSYGSWTSLYEYCWHYQMVPARRPAWCSIEFKQKPLKAYYEKPCFELLGIDAGESKRARISSTDGVETRWPLIEHNIDRQGCKDIIKDYSLTVPIKSGCYICPNQTYAQWRELRKSHPDLFCKAVQLEKRNVEYQKAKGRKVGYMDSNNKSLEEIVQENQYELWEDMRPPCYCTQ